MPKQYRWPVEGKTYVEDDPKTYDPNVEFKGRNYVRKDSNLIPLVVAKSDHGLIEYVDPPRPVPIGIEDVKAEAARRLMLAFGQPDIFALEHMIRDAMQEATGLLDARLEAQDAGGDWTPEQAARAAQLRGARAIVDAHDSASKTLRALDPIPDDYIDDKHWPQ